jgi:hypothetical protein
MAAEEITCTRLSREGPLTSPSLSAQPEPLSLVVASLLPCCLLLPQQLAGWTT